MHIFPPKATLPDPTVPLMTRFAPLVTTREVPPGLPERLPLIVTVGRLEMAPAQAMSVLAAFPIRPMLPEKVPFWSTSVAFPLSDERLKRVVRPVLDISAPLLPVRVRVPLLYAKEPDLVCDSYLRIGVVAGERCAAVRAIGAIDRMGWGSAQGRRERKGAKGKGKSPGN